MTCRCPVHPSFPVRDDLDVGSSSRPPPYGGTDGTTHTTAPRFGADPSSVSEANR